MVSIIKSTRVTYRTAGLTTPHYKGQIRSFDVIHFVRAKIHQGCTKIILHNPNGIEYCRYALDCPIIIATAVKEARYGQA